MTAPGVPRETSDRLGELERLIRAEALVQNLVSAATLDDFQTRHIADSLQLLPLAPASGQWLDIGTGAGFPGLALALATTSYSFLLVEPRALRAAFLDRMVHHFDLHDRVGVTQRKVERIEAGSFDIVSARAVASIERLFAMAAHVTHGGTRWLLPRGRSAREELAAARRTWQGDFRLVPSLTDPAAAILVANGVKRRTKP